MIEKPHNKLEFTFGGFHYEIARTTRDPAKEPDPNTLKIGSQEEFYALRKLVKAIEVFIVEEPKGLTLCDVFAKEEKPESWKINPEWEKATYRQIPKSSPFEMTQYVKYGDTFAMVGEVVQRHDGTKYVASGPHLLAFGDKVICQRPHADNDFSYMCGQPHCRCMN